MKYLKSIISCAIISLMTPTLSFAQEAGYWGYGSLCRARCAPGREQMGPFRNSAMTRNGPNVQANFSYCMNYAKSYCGGVGYSTPNKPVPTIQYCSSPTSNEMFEYFNVTGCPPGQTPEGPPVPQYY
jgi:hypothetical protein